MFDEIAPVYDYLSWFFLPNTKKYILNNVQMSKNDKILDIGGGTGKLIETILKENTKVKGYVLDKSISMLKRSSLEEKVIVGDSATLPFGSNCFDFVFCIDALHHFEDKHKSLKEMIRVSKPDGEIIILELDPNNYLSKFIEYAERVMGESSKFYEKQYLKNVFLKRDFRVRIEKINFLQYILHAKR